MILKKINFPFVQMAIRRECYGKAKMVAQREQVPVWEQTVAAGKGVGAEGNTASGTRRALLGIVQGFSSSSSGNG